MGHILIKKKKQHDYSKVLARIQKEIDEFARLEDYYKTSGQYSKAHDAVVQWLLLQSLHVTIGLMQWEK